MDNFAEWLNLLKIQYQQLSDDERNATIDCLISTSGASQLWHLCNHIEQLRYRDFLKLLPPELRECVLCYLDGKSLLKACCVSRTWNQLISSSTRTWQHACMSLGLVINNYFNSTDSSYWKSYFIEMMYRLNEMKMGNSFMSKIYDRHLRRVTAVYYSAGKLATASDSKTIQLWDCHKDECLLTLRTDASVAAIMFDDELLIVSSYLGHLVSWDLSTGQRLMEYFRHVGAVFTFDYCKDLNIVVSGSADTRIKIWSLQQGNMITTLQGHSLWVLKVLLRPFNQTGINNEQIYHLFSMDKDNIMVWMLQAHQPKTLTVTSLYTIPIRGKETNLFIPGLHFDGNFLFFMKDSNPNAYLCKWDVSLKKMDLEISLKCNVKVLLGVGQKYAAIVTPWPSKGVPNFIVFDLMTLENVAMWHLPPSRPSTPVCSQMTLGDCRWLDGLDGKNDHGVLLAAGLDDNSVYVVKWCPRIEEDTLPHLT